MVPRVVPVEWAVRMDRGLSDLKAHLIYANMDATHRAEGLLTHEQRQTLLSGGAHVVTSEQTR